MDLKDRVKQVSEKVKDLKIREAITNEAATKNAFIEPFIRALGYDTSNPLEVALEYTADVAGKKGEKIDYAILRDSQPIVFIECKHWKENLNNHDEQLQRYFNVVPTVKFAILTNGITYKFFTDSDRQNIMDGEPFFEFDITKIKDSTIDILDKYCRENFVLDNNFEYAKELKYASAVKSALAKEIDSPSPEFIKFILKENNIYKDGVMITDKVINKFNLIVKKSLNQIINELVDEKFNSAIEKKEKQKEEEEKALLAQQQQQEETKQIETTEEEKEAFFIIRGILRGAQIDISRVSSKDTLSYFAIYLDNKITRTFCRLYFPTEAQKKKYIGISDTHSDKENKILIESLDDLYKYSDELIKAVSSYDEKK